MLTNFYNTNGVFIGGGQIGGNDQIGSFVIGGEWDFDWPQATRTRRSWFLGSFAAIAAASPSSPFAPATAGPPLSFLDQSLASTTVTG